MVYDGPSNVKQRVWRGTPGQETQLATDSGRNPSHVQNGLVNMLDKGNFVKTEHYYRAWHRKAAKSNRSPAGALGEIKIIPSRDTCVCHSSARAGRVGDVDQSNGSQAHETSDVDSLMSAQVPRSLNSTGPSAKCQRGMASAVLCIVSPVSLRARLSWHW